MLKNGDTISVLMTTSRCRTFLLGVITVFFCLGQSVTPLGAQKTEPPSAPPGESAPAQTPMPTPSPTSTPIPAPANPQDPGNQGMPSAYSLPGIPGQTPYSVMSPGYSNLGGMPTRGTTPPAGSSPIFISGIGSGLAALMPYDPVMDNHLKAPAKPLGLFGLPVKQVEQALRNYGAKPYSYAFGKQSRMTFSVYIVTLMFDRYRKLGSIFVDPRPPFSKVEPKAQAFFLRLFLPPNGMEEFSTKISGTRLEISFVGTASETSGKGKFNRELSSFTDPGGF